VKFTGWAKCNGKDFDKSMLYIRNYEDVDGTSAMQNGEDQCCLYNVHSREGSVFGRECCNAKQRELCVSTQRTKASGRDCGNAKFVSNPVAYISLSGWEPCSAIRTENKDKCTITFKSFRTGPVQL
jgi:hypothetical protein